MVVSTFGDLPLYKAHAFEDEVKNVLLTKTQSISEDIQKSMQKAEDHMWKRFPSNKKVLPGVSIVTGL